ncbi:hypothetical protein ACFP2T_00060 [Plantactinospora solaniradicis]|uniref:Uncharacterized protein n=1 Tax=Plantactinospora solaniradicis TaxID=1723736 RepID=A0ABW1JZV5_9ACTN
MMVDTVRLLAELFGTAIGRIDRTAVTALCERARDSTVAPPEQHT